MILLLIAGIGVILAGLVAIAFGIPVKEFGFGNTLILTGTIGACTGLIMISLAIVVREIRHFVPAEIDGAPEAMPRPPRHELPPWPGDTRPADDTEAPEPAPRPLFSRDEPAAERAGTAPPWQDDASRDSAEPEEASAAVEPPEEPKRRNLLFSSTRRERERAEAERAAAAAGTEPPEATPARPSFADAWPATERGRPEFPRRPRAPTTFADAPSDPPLIPERPVLPPRREAPAAETAEVSVLKSGVVDGMAYSLYSDGSIEAQMPEGMMRFASIDELREHLDQRS
jgi:hypothetical protein